ncbi:hypothetical protein C1I97_27770 [Streptomyces sp. NTH33]|uniref:hypothetical protein n=1 Tax=Streptomyces sp. NTH33 TaxID=1735453 RepID=UPI000DA9B597|nr:hypothetical protein [Streptomyces sp. NTH33]PZG94454.1 hypothetical protein C1I97_27770 [Streptomyces sp. NTH33]
MNPSTYTRLYGPRPSVPRRARTGVVVLAAVLWGLTLVSCAWLAYLVGVVVFVSAGADGAWAPAGSFLLWCALVVAGAVGVLTAVAFVPGVRRLAPESRLLLLGVLACPAPTLLAVLTWTGLT